MLTIQTLSTKTLKLWKLTHDNYSKIKIKIKTVVNA